jgi:competence protein ComFB
MNKEGPMQLVNFMEEAVKRVLEDLLKDPPYQSNSFDEKTKLDIMAYTLNHLPARYVVSEKGHLYTRVDELRQQFKTDIIVELTRAINQVKSHPR